MKGVENFSATDELLIEKRRLLEQWLEEEGIKPSPTITSSRRKDFAELPLSFAQQRLWFIDQLEQGSPFYNVPSAVRLQGTLNLQALRESFDEIIRRHEVLRTSFREVDGQPVQVIASELSLNLSTTDLRGLTPTERETKARQLASEEARRPFDLQRGPLLRIKLMRLSEDEHILLVVMHHIVSDGWSVGVLLRELATLYGAFSAGQTSMLANPSIQYVDYTLWQREWLQGKVLESQLAYWKRQLDGLVPMLELPTDRIRPKVRSFRGAQVFGQLSKSLSDKLLALSRHEDVTLFMTLLAAFNVLLCRYTGQEDIAVGSPIANRVRPETEDLIGFFANTLVLRTDLSGEPSFRRLLNRVRTVALEAYAHQDIPFEKLVEELQPERDMSRHPLFQVAFSLQNTPLPALEVGDLKLSTVDIDTGTAKFDLTLIVEETERGLTTLLEYDTDLFEEQTVARMLDHFQTLLEGIVAEPDRRISELPLVGATERDQLLHKWNDVRSAHHQDACVHQLFETQAERTPDAVALVHEDEQLSYKELNRRANQLAHHLRNRGVGPESLIAIMAEPSTEMIVGLLGILKAGAAYLPLDPSYPRERLQFMIEDAKPAVILTQEVISAADYTDQSHGSDPDLIRGFDPRNPCYVIYTSGSTGTPKGVVVTHANVVRLFSATQQYFDFNANDTWTLFHSYAFDFSVWELWGALLHGGRLVIVPYWVSRSPDAFLDLLVREQVTVLNQTPSAFRQLMQVDESADVGQRLALRLVIFGGEALELQSLRPWFDRHRDERPQLVNMYGITETTVHVTYRSLSKADLEKTSGSLIGGPIPDLCVYILDRHLEPAPFGVAGEMYISGAGLARGYLRCPELTAERFIPHPFSREAGARLYRTGDRARRLSCGDIEYLGRIDQQVKIRGFRIELGEVEAALARHPAIRESVVLARQDTPDEKRLVAYIVPREDQSPTVGELRQVMKEKLPDYMVPAAFVFLDKLPLTPQGKIDRLALPRPDRERPEGERAYAAPSNPIEETLAEIWSEVLGMDQVGVDDNYIALGGDSIRSIQVRAKAQQRGLQFSLQQLFQHQTIRELAQALNVTDDEGASTHRRQPFSLISTEDRRKLSREVEDAYPLSHMQAGLVFHSKYSPDYAIYITSFYLRLPLDVQKLKAAVEQVVSRHEMLRTSFDLNGFSEPLQLVHRSVEIPLHIEDLRHIASEQQQAWLYDWMETELHRKFDWSCAPLLRLSVHKRSDESFQFTLSEPFFDGWSVASLVTELFERYLALLKGSPLAIKPLSATYSDFVALEREALLSTETQHYWTQKLSEATASKLPRHPSSGRAERPLKVSRVIVPISPEVSDGVQRLARSIGVSLKSVLLAAHLKVVSLMSGQADVFTGLFVNGRPERADGERVLGIFLNILPLRFKLQGGAWADLARGAFEAEQELLPFRRYPIQELQRIHGAEDLFDTAFVFTHFHVYQRLQNMVGAESLLHEGNEQTYYALTAQFNLDETSSRVHLALDYRELELCREQVETIAGYYTRVLAAIVNDPQAHHESLCFLSEQEQHLLAAWNEMALTANGKANRRVFPDPEASAISEGNFVAPRTPVEELLANLWAQAFNVEQVGVFDNFFDLGGHSLLAMRLISCVGNAFQVELSVHSLFELPTIASLAEGIEEMLSEGQSREALPILPVPRSKQLSLSFAQQRLWFMDQLEQGSSFYNIPSAVRLQGMLNLQALCKSFNEIIRRHEALRTSFREVDGQPAQVIAAELRLELPILDLSVLPEAVREAEVQRLAREEVQRPFDLSQCPLLRAQLIRLSETEHALIVAMHHIISDGWSLGIFMQELTELYSAFASGQVSPLAELPIQYVDFAQWQREWLRGETLQTQLEHWKKQLAGAPALLELPTDRPRPKVQTFRGAKYPLALSAKLSEETKALSRREGATLFMTLFAIYLALLHHYTKQTDMVVGTAVANRNRAEIENLIGFFVNTLALRTNLSGDPAFSELLSHVREVSLAAYAHQDLPFEKLVEELQPARDPKYPPLVQVMFVLENAPMSDPELSGLSFSPISIDGGGSKFDLALLVLETNEGLTCFFEYNTDLFEAATISRMAGHYETLLRSVIAQPETRLSMLGEVLDEAERRQHIVQEREYEEIIQRKLERIIRRAAT